MFMMAMKIKILLMTRKYTQAQLAKDLNMSPSNLSNRLRRDNFTERELSKIAEILNAKLEAGFILNDTGKSI